MKREMNAIGVALGVVLLTAIPGLAQVSSGAIGYYNDVARFTQTSAFGSTRSTSMGGAQVAIGADASNMFGNPAGLGMYRRNEFAFGLHFQNSGSQAGYNDGRSPDSRATAGISSITYVAANAKKAYDGGKLRAVNWGLGISRNATFRNRYSFVGNSADFSTGSNSLRDFYADLGAGFDTSVLNIPNDQTTYNERLVKQGYNTYLLDKRQPGNSTFTSYVPRANYRQSGTVSTKGNVVEMAFAGAGNWDDKFYFGGGIGIPFVSYEEERVYSEEITSTDNRPGGSTYIGARGTLTENNTFSGVGINLKAGMIYVPTEFLRLGVSAQTPTRLAMSQDYSNKLSYNYGSATYIGLQNYTLDGVYEDDFSTPRYEYRVLTPGKAQAGMSIFFKKRGFITGEVEYVNYASGAIRSDNNELSADDRSVNNIYKTAAINYKVGAELKVDKYALRAGYRYMENPYRSSISLSDQVNSGITTLSGGIGYRETDYAIDFVLTRSNWSSKTKLLPFTQGVNADYQLIQAMLSCSFYF